MKKYPSVWIIKKLKDKSIVWDISVKMRADIEATHYEKQTKEEAIKFCNESYGGYDSITEQI